MAARVIFRGKTLNQRTIDMIERAEARLGHKLEIMQGSYNAGRVGASAGTHDGGGAADFRAPTNPGPAVRALREAGFAAWYRPALSGVWPRHIHAIAIGDPDLSSGARNQVTSYYNHRNGLANNGWDSTWRPDPIDVWPVRLPLISRKNAEFQFRRRRKRNSAAVRKIQRVLNRRLGTNLAVDGIAGPQTRAAYKRWEQRVGAPEADGIPGKFSLDRLVNGFYRPVL